jgi:hypothetical protein
MRTPGKPPTMPGPATKDVIPIAPITGRQPPRPAEDAPHDWLLPSPPLPVDDDPRWSRRLRRRRRLPPPVLPPAAQEPEPQQPRDDAS